MNNNRNTGSDKLRRLTEILLDSQLPAFSLRPEVLELVELLGGSAENRFMREGEIALGETRTASGLALSPTMAAMCADDYVRTIVFIRGISEAIKDVREQGGQRPVRVLYAGCGPFGTLVVPLMVAFDCSEAVFTLLDIHPESVQSVKAVVRNLDLEGSVSGVVATDALKYTVDPEQPPDVIVTETMQACLDAEPQVAITRHLLAQAPNAVLVPQEIRIDLNLIDPGCEFNSADLEGGADSVQRDRVSLGAVFVVNKEMVNSWSSSNRCDALPAGSILLPEPWEDRYQPMLFTRIQVYREHSMEAYDSGLTCPKVVKLDGSKGAGDEIHFIYVLGSNPHLSCEDG